ncbi:hypothetical protein DFJ73DRAFT_777178 [Zopfochytrium polystomum]|nr:hypothetical protein DFJ73DRAFT_777178 [Zopfochytrium polystomum]
MPRRANGQPISAVIAVLSAGDPSDPWNPLFALAAAGARLDALKIGILALSKDIVAALGLLDVPHDLVDRFAQLFPRLRSLAIGDFPGVVDLAPKLVGLNSKSLVSALRHLSLQLARDDDDAFTALMHSRGAGLRSLKLSFYLLQHILLAAPNRVALEIINCHFAPLPWRPFRLLRRHPTADAEFARQAEEVQREV